MSGVVGRARHALLRALSEPDGNLALKVLERVLPELAPTERVGYGGGISKLNFSTMTDQQLARIKAGEHPYVVLAQTRALLDDSLVRDGEILQLPPVQEDAAEE